MLDSRGLPWTRSGVRRNDDVFRHARLDKPAPYLIRGHPETRKTGRFFLLNWLKTSQSLNSNVAHEVRRYTSRTLFLASLAFLATLREVQACQSFSLGYLTLTMRNLKYRLAAIFFSSAGQHITKHTLQILVTNLLYLTGAETSREEKIGYLSVVSNSFKPLWKTGNSI